MQCNIKYRKDKLMSEIYKIISSILITISFSFPVISNYNLIEKSEINYPLSEQAVQGIVDIIGEIKIDNFESYYLFFSPEKMPTDTWFLIAQGFNLGKDLTLGSWDTSTISDGDYTLRLLIIKTNQETVEVIVNKVRVRNYTPFSTNTPTPLPTGPNTQTPTPTLPPNTPTQIPPTDFPSNPAELTYSNIERSMTKAIILVFSLFILLLSFRAVKKQ